MITDLLKEDWQLIAGWVQDRFSAAAPKKGEPPPSKEFLAQEDRIMGFLLRKAYRSNE